MVKAERESRNAHGNELHRDITQYEIRQMQLASIADIAASMRHQLIILVEWAKQIPLFMQKLPLDDQVCCFDMHVSRQYVLEYYGFRWHCFGHMLENTSFWAWHDDP